MDRSLKTTVRAGLLCASLLAPFSAAYAADGTGRFAVEGVGQLKCDVYMTHSENDGPEIAALAAWVNGYVTAYNRLAPQTFDLTPWQTVQVLLIQLRQYCAVNSDATFETATSELMSFLASDRLQNVEDIIAISNGKNSVMLYESVRTAVEAKLIELGYKIKDQEGGLSLAILDFQAAKNLTPSGLPDQRTLLQLFGSR